MSETVNGPLSDVLQWSVIRARGLDAETFLQGQLSQDLTNLDEGGSWALLLTPDSVVITSCFVRSVDDGFDVVVPRALAEEATKRLRRFLLRSKCTLEVDDIDVGPMATLDERIQRDWPGETEFALSLTPHSFGRRFVNATISFTKGCFTGQELVGRLDARGSSVPWRFVRVDAPSVERANEVLKSKGPDGPQGVTSAQERDGRWVGLGIAHRTLLSALLSATDGDVTVVEID
jgi:folate-binding Fe-S cluster repair protein YgfZ